MKRIYLFCGCVVALFAVTAFSQGSKPCCESAQDAKCCEKQAVAGKPCCQTVEYAVKATPCSCAAAAKKDTSPATCCCAVTVKATATTRQANVYDLLEKLEALQAKKDGLESEIRETRALLNEKFHTLQERVAKVGMTPHGSPYAPAIAPVTMHGHYEPVTTYTVILEKNPQTGETKRIATPVTSYVPRESVPTVTTFGVPLTATFTTAPAPAAMPYPSVPPQPATPVNDCVCPGPITTATVPAVTPRTTKTGRPSKPEAPKTPPTAIPSPNPVQPKPPVSDSIDDSWN